MVKEMVVSVIKEIEPHELPQGFEMPSKPKLIPDNEEELWQIFQSLPENYTLLFGAHMPFWSGLLYVFHDVGDVWAATSAHQSISSVDGKWHKATEILLRHLCTQIYNLGENNDIYYFTVKSTQKNEFKEEEEVLLQEAMFPKEFNREALGSCMVAAELATKHLLSKGRKDFKVVEGWVAFDDDHEIIRKGKRYLTQGNVCEHTWIEFDNGRIFDPTKKQWIEWGYDPAKSKIVKIHKKYTPRGYLSVCGRYPSNWEDYKKKQVKEDSEKEVKSILSRLNDDNLFVSVQRDPSTSHIPGSWFVQVDAIINRKNLFSSNPEDLTKWGYPVPSTREILEKIPHGQYKLSDIKRRLQIPLKEAMFPKGFNRHDAVCISAAALATKYLLERNITNFKVVDGNMEADDGRQFFHVWIQFDNGRIFDPTKKQWKIIHNLDPESMKYKPDRVYDPMKYLSLRIHSVLNTISNLQKSKNHKIEENMTYDELTKLTSNTPRSPNDNTNRIDRSKNVRVRSIPVSIEEGLEQWNFRYKSNLGTGDPGNPLEGHITFLKGEVEKDDDAQQLECKVDCSCPDYKYKFAYNNAKQGASDIGAESLNKCINRSPQPAYNIGEGLCKHLCALSRYLQTKIGIQRPSNLFETIGEIARQGPFNITYYD